MRDSAGTSFSTIALSSLGAACWQGGLVILVVWLVCRYVKGLSPTVRQGLWWLACLKLLVTALWVRPIVLHVLPSRSAKFQPGFLEGGQGPSSHALPSLPAAFTVGIDWTIPLAVIWISGAAVLLVATTYNAMKARRIAQRAESIDDSELGREMRGLAAQLGLTVVPRLLVSNDVSSPCVLGHIRPVVLVPRDIEANLSQEEQRMAIAHELAHIRRAHLWLALVPSCAFALFYFFPPAWIACREWATDREASCDLDAIDATGVSPKSYGEMLMKIARADHRRFILGLGTTRQFHTIRRRMISIFDRSSASPTNWACFTMLAALAAVIVPISLAAPASPAGILSNSGFEDGVDQPYGWQAVRPNVEFDLEWDSTQAHTGRRSVRITRRTNQFWPIAQWVHELPMQLGATSLQFGAWIKADHAEKAVLDAQFQSFNGKWSHRWVAFVGQQMPGRGPANHDWAPYSGVVNIPPGTTRIRVALQDYGPGTVWMDDAFVQFFSASDTPR